MRLKGARELDGASQCRVYDAGKIQDGSNDQYGSASGQAVGLRRGVCYRSRKGDRGVADGSDSSRRRYVDFNGLEFKLLDSKRDLTIGDELRAGVASRGDHYRN